MITKRILPLFLIMVIFTACGSKVSNCECETTNYDGKASNYGGEASNYESEVSNHESEVSNYWEELIKDVPKGAFEQTDSEIFVWEQNGYSVEIELDKWFPNRGSNEYILHPASDEILLPLLKPSDGVIPFVLTAKTTTKDSDFTTNFSFSVETRGRAQLFSCSQSRFEDTLERLTREFDGLPAERNTKEYRQERMPPYLNLMSSGIIVDSFSETKLGDEQVLYGCYVINNYYSPEFPDGNFERFPGGSDIMYLRMQGDPVQEYPPELVDVVMH